jgi:hypothetical protein
MSLLARAHAGLIALLLACLPVTSFGAPAVESNVLDWQKEGVSVSASQWPVKKLLARLSAATGWKIFFDPSINELVTVRFSRVSPGEALRLLLGTASYALVPQPKGGFKLYVYRTRMDDATSLVNPESERPKNRIANELILTLAPGSEVDVAQLASELGGKIVAQSDELNAYRLQFPDAETAQTAREKLAARQGFDTQDNYSFDRPTAPGASSGSLASMFPLDATPVARGQEVKVALVDTPVQPLEGKMKDFLLPSVHVAGTPTSLPTDPTHGTSMAETLLNSMIFTKGATTDASKLGAVRLLPIDIYGNESVTTTFEVAQGLYQAIQSGAQVINLSLGGTGESPMVDYLLDIAKKKEILVFASAGNSPTTDLTWPAANPNTIAVTAADFRGNIAPYANRGDFVDVKAPGTSRIVFNGQTYISTGTSTATAFVSGQAVGLTAQGLSAGQTTDLILRNFDVNAAPAATGSNRAR